MTVDVAASAAIDGANNPSIVATRNTQAVDMLAPILAIDATLEGDNKVNADEDNTFTVSGTSSGVVGQTVSFTVTDSATSPAGTVIGTAVVGADGTWTADVNVSGLANGDLTVTANVSDVAGNPSAQASGIVLLDNVAPTVTIDDDQAGTGNIAGGTIVYTFTFAEPVTGFDADDVAVVNGEKGTFTALSATEYTLVVTPTAEF